MLQAERNSCLSKGLVVKSAVDCFAISNGESWLKHCLPKNTQLSVTCQEIIVLI